MSSAPACTLGACVATLVLLAWCGAVGQGARAQGDSTLSVRPGREVPVRATPGVPLTLPFSVQAGVAGDYEDSVALPAGWRRLTAGGSFRLGAGAQTVRFLTLVVPPAARAGGYDVTYRVSPSGRKGRDSASIRVRVPVRRDVRIEPLRTPSFVVGGDTLSVLVQVDNAGNVPETVRLRRSASLGVLQGDAPTFDVSSGKSRRVRIRTVLPPDLRSRTDHTLELTAVAGDTARASTRFKTPVFPSRRFRGGDAYHRYPIMLTATTSGVQRPDQTGLGYQFRATGDGTLWENGRTDLAFEARAPGAEDVSFFLRRRTQYTLDLTRPNARLNLGDQSFGLTDLAGGQGSFGAGAGASWRGVGAYGYAARSRFGVESRHAGGRLDARWGPDDAYQVGLNGVVQDGRLQGRVLTADVALRPSDDLQLAAEHGRSAGPDGGGTATQVEGDVQFEYGSVRGRYARTGTDYPQFGGGRSFYSGGARLSPPLPLTLDGSASLSRFGASNRGRLNATLGIGNRLALGYEQERFSEAPTSVWRPDARRDAALAQIDAGFSSLRANLRARLGTVTSTSAGGTSPLNQRYRLRMTLGAAPGLDLRFGAEYQDETSLRGTGRQTEFEGRMGVDWQLAETTDARLAVVLQQRSRSLIGDTPLQVRARTGVTHTFAATGHTLSLNARFSRGTLGLLRNGISLEYKAPLEIPIHRSQETGAVRGRLLDTDAETGIGGVPVRLDDQGVVTDPAGRFAFTGVDSGRYRLRVDQEALGPGRTLTQSPGQVVVRGGQDTSVRLRARPTGTVAGRVRIERRVGVGTDTTRTDPLSNALVALTTDKKERQQRTGPDGRFTFYGVPSGTHALQLLPESLPEQTRADPSRKTVALRDTATEVVRFMVRSREREIQFLDPGEGPSGDTSVTDGKDVVAERNETRVDTSRSPRGSPTGLVGSFAVQVGAFQNRSNARSRARRAQRRGHSVLIQPERQAGRTLYQVWVGNYRSRAAATQAARALQSLTPNAFVTTVSPTGSFTVQLGPFPEINEALRRARRARQNGLPAYVRVERPEGGTAYMVWVGSYKRRSDAKQRARTLAPNPTVVRTTDDGRAR